MQTRSTIGAGSNAIRNAMRRGNSMRKQVDVIENIQIPLGWEMSLTFAAWEVLK
jgi:hypothetical protein